MGIIEDITRCRIIPVIAIGRAEDIVPLCQALSAGGLFCAEITFRTEAGREALKIAAETFPEFLVGAGTVTRPEEVEAAAKAGARFAVAPGTNPTIVRLAQQAGLPFFPGVFTPSDIECALELGCETLKFFPAESAGGLKNLRAIHAPYKHRGVRFIPTGGITTDNMVPYLAYPGVAAIGASWMVADELLKAQDWAEVERRTRLAVEAAALAKAQG